METPTPTETTTHVPSAQPSTDATDTHQKLLDELALLRTELEKLNSYNVFAWNNLLPRALLMQFMKGAFLALGSLVGATIILSSLMYALSQIEVIPIIGEWIRELNLFLKAHQ
jgi:hypothetical protein